MFQAGFYFCCCCLFVFFFFRLEHVGRGTLVLALDYPELILVTYNEQNHFAGDFSADWKVEVWRTELSSHGKSKNGEVSDSNTTTLEETPRRGKTAASKRYEPA